MLMSVIISTTTILSLLAIILAVHILLIANDVPASVFISLTEKAQLNFTEADKDCRLRFPPYGRLFIPEDLDDENRFISDLKKQPEAYHRACPRVFIGIRVRLVEKYRKLRGGRFILPLEFESLDTKEVSPSIPNGTSCIANTYSVDNHENELKSVACTGGTYNCALCEILPGKYYEIPDLPPFARCPRNFPICYVVWHNSKARPFNDVPELCKGIGGRMSMIANFQFTDYQSKRVVTKLCNGLPVAALSAPISIVLETITGKRMDYDVKNLEPGASIDNCISGSTDSQYPLKYSSCFIPQCYACQITRPKKEWKPF